MAFLRTPVPGPDTRARADQPWEGGGAHTVRGRERTGDPSEGPPTLPAGATIRQPSVTGGHRGACEHGDVGQDGFGDGKRVLLAAPRGYCAGVERAVEAVERALDKHGAPVYVRKQIVHNLHVVRDLEAKGAIFVDEIDQVPVGAVTVLSAHGSPPSVYEEARRRELELIDATCPLVTKVHVEARRFAGEGRTIVLIGHAGHEEVEGTSGQAPDATILVQDLEDAARVELPGGPLAYLTQTTLSVDETGQIVSALRDRYPDLQPPPREDICYATQNRQDAVKAIAPLADVVLVIGSKNSSNSNRLAEVARELGAAAHLVDDETEVDEAWLADAAAVGVTSGASAPEHLVERMLAWLAERGFGEVEQVPIAEEGVRFSLPVGVRPVGD
jgi:4-hydroxy-3-methylbut-2-en-1-yl diphosphate reductase